jgi:Tol biopolymer transport system component
MKWSPDSRTLAAAGVVYARPRSMLYTVSVPEGRVTGLDTLDVLAAYEFSWSPDGRWIAFSRPTQLDHLGEDPIAADLWIAEAESGETWLVLETPDWVESNPLWITNRSIQIDRFRLDGDQRGVEQRVVVELSKEDSRRTQD